MVFGWGKKKKIVDESVETVTTEQKHITISEVDKIIAEIKSLRLEKLLNQAQSMRASFIERRASIIGIIYQLEGDDLKLDDVDIHLKIQIKREKSVVISGIKKETSIDLVKVGTYQDVIDLNSTVAKMLKRIGDILGKNTKVMHGFARKYSSKLKNNLRVMTSEQENLQKIVDNHDKFESDSNEALNASKYISKSKIEVQTKKKMITEIENKLREDQKKIEQLNHDIKKLKSQKEYQEFIKTKSDIGALSSDEFTIKNLIDLQFSKISRPLGKYSYISAFEKPLKKLMGRLIENPTDVIMPENKDSVIQILEAVNKAVISGSISVKDSEKSVQQIRETIGSIDEFITQKRKFLEKKESLEKKLDAFDFTEIQNKEKILSETIGLKNESESNLANLKNDINDAEKRIPRLISDTEIKLKEISGKKLLLRD